MSRIYVGIDSGGTRTNVYIEPGDDGAAELVRLRTYEVAESLSGALANELVPATLRKILAPLAMALVDPMPQDASLYIWISAAGFTQWTRDVYVQSLREVVPGVIDAPVEAVGAANDAVSLLLGERADGIIIAGTGSSVVVRSRDGDLHQAGGQEWVACDSGSGFWIGLRGIRRAFRDYEDKTESVLLQRMRQLYGIRSQDDVRLVERVRELAVGDKDTKKEIARFAVEVCGAAQRGDQDAQDIVKSEAEDLADVTAGSLRRSVDIGLLEGSLTLIQCGSVMTNPFFASLFEKQLAMRLLPDYQGATEISWRQVVTGADAAISLARDLVEAPSAHLNMNPFHRPAVLEFRPVA